MRMEGTKTDLGTIRIHKKVIASIASLAASEIEGVKRAEKGFKTSLYQLFGKKSSSGIKVDIDRNNEVRLEIPLVIEYGYNLPSIANKVQENIQYALGKMTNLSIKDININIQRIERS